MKVKKVEINGFKSFMDHTSLEFDDAVTAIVGPNGCGKSNVADAIKWVMGEQASSRLRGKSMADVIFNGSEKYGPSGMAEVIITFANDGKNVPAQYASYHEIAVSRRLFRSGESEYMINKVPTRLLDVVELFLGTGVGTRTYSIIEQGMVSDIISFRPEERRLFIEEAAGITRYRARKRMALRKMDATRSNLQRIEDIIGEISRQLNAVQRQARRAEKFKKLRDEARSIERRSIERRYFTLCTDLLAMEGESVRLSDEDAALSARLASVDAGIEAGRAGLLDEERNLAAAQEQLYRTETALREKEASLSLARREIEGLDRRNSEHAAKVEALGRRIAQGKAEEAQEEERRTGIAQMLDVHRALKAEHEQALAQSRAECASFLREADEAKAAIVEALTQAAHHRNHLMHLSERDAETRARLARCRAEIDSLERARTETAARRDAIRKKLDQSRQLVLDLGAQEDALRQTLTELRAEHMSAEAKGIAVKEELAHKRSRLLSLSELQERYEGFQKGVRSVMARKVEAEKEGRDAGVYGLVADIIETTPDYETAVEAVLGERLQYVIVKSQEEGVAAIDWLKNSAEGRSTFIPMSLKQYASGGSFPTGTGIIGSAKGLVTYDPSYEAVVDYLLGDAVLVDSLSNALVIWSANGYRKTLVTLDGEVIGPEGTVTGGRGADQEAGFLARKREIRELQAATRELETESRMVAEQQRRLRSHIAQVETGLENLRNDAHTAEIGAVGVEKELHREEEELGRMDERRRLAAFDAEQAEAVLREVAGEIERSRAELSRLDAEKDSQERRIQEITSALNAARERERACEEELAAEKVREAGDEERLRSIAAVVERIGREVKGMQDEVSALFETISGDTRLLSGHKDTCASLDAEIRVIVGDLAGVKDDLGDRRGRYDARAAGVRAAEDDLRTVRESLDAVRGRIGALTLRRSEADLSRRHLLESTRDRIDVDLAVAAFDPGNAPPPLSDEEEERLSQIKAQLDEMGEINLLAIREFEDLTSRKEFLETHRADLEKSLDALQRAIQKINRTSRERFMETFTVIDAKFKEVFPRLFHGGRAGLRLMDETDVLESGVDITAQPPGKKLQSIDLLSGGEKALTAISLIFSIFLIKPSPFCLMDEVDAPLDDANIGRFLSMLSELAAGSQFIVITHNKRTMEVARKLYGVTMEEPGVSKLISVRVSREAAA
ncbi:MAG: chromosome segregation protein SMC [Deltaproteobacteria bacterium]|nr:chromosome segregation protein SMC [Deltaproteobacteria bacterium]